MALINWGIVRGFIIASFWTFFFILLAWVFQIQCILQIIINRISLIMHSHDKARKLRLVVFLIMVCINISVFCIWIPARMQITETWIHINSIWDRIEKCIYAVIDASLNFFFIWLVRTRLVALGLTKYQALYRFNLIMMILSVCLDVLLIGLMSLSNDSIYLQFQSLSYLLKLHIELNMAEFLSKIVKGSNPLKIYDEIGATYASQFADPRVQEVAPKDTTSPLPADPGQTQMGTLDTSLFESLNDSLVYDSMPTRTASVSDERGENYTLNLDTGPYQPDVSNWMNGTRRRFSV
ncbi:hypothetical protein BX600DRAFT_472077, partial [Xylariales sp. PMI_506]